MPHVDRFFMGLALLALSAWFFFSSFQRFTHGEYGAEVLRPAGEQPRDAILGAVALASAVGVFRSRSRLIVREELEREMASRSL